MEKFLVKTIEEKIKNLERTQMEKIENMKKEQKIDQAYAQLNKRKEEALEEIRSHGAGSKEASIDLEKIEKELEKVKMAELNIAKKVERDIGVTKEYLTEINSIIFEKEKAQKENEIIEKDIKKLTQYQDEALAEIRKCGEGSKEASKDLEKIEAELKNKNEIKDKNKEIIEQFNKKIDEFMQRSDIKKILEEKSHNETELDENEQDNIQKQNQGQEQNKNEGQNQDTKYNMILDISGNTMNVNENDKLFYKTELKKKEEIKEKYSIGSYFKINKKAEKFVDYALISALEKVDDKGGNLVKAYLKVIGNGKSQSEEVKECLEKISNAVDITYKFDKKDGILLNRKEKRIARYAKMMGIASLEGISEKSPWDKISDKAKEIFSKVKSKKIFKIRKEPEALVSGEKTEERQNRNVRSIYEAPEDVKQNIDDISRRYLEQEKEQEKHRAEEVKRIQNEEKEKRLQSDEEFVIGPDER